MLDSRWCQLVESMMLAFIALLVVDIAKSERLMAV
jgi:hypothetical protein